MYKYKYFIVGKSGSGKSTIIDAYCTKYNTNQLLSYTTRPIRDCEIENPTHIHINEEEYKLLTDDLVAYDYYNNYNYGATKQQVLENDFFIVNQNGIEVIKQKMPKLKFKVIFVDVDDDILIKRMQHRGDSKNQINDRLKQDILWKEQIKLLVDFYLINDKGILDAVHVLYKYIKSIEENENV